MGIINYYLILKCLVYTCTNSVAAFASNLKAITTKSFNNSKRKVKTWAIIQLLETALVLVTIHRKGVLKCIRDKRRLNGTMGEFKPNSQFKPRRQVTNLLQRLHLLRHRLLQLRLLRIRLLQ